MPFHSVTVRDEDSGETVHLSHLLAEGPDRALDRAADVPLEEFSPGSAVIDFYQLDPELDSFSYGYFSRLEDAQTAGLFTIRQLYPDRDWSYVKAEPERLPSWMNVTPPEVWRVVNASSPASIITMCQIVKYDLWTSPDPVTNPASES